LVTLPRNLPVTPCWSVLLFSAGFLSSSTCTVEDLFLKLGKLTGSAVNFSVQLRKPLVFFFSQLSSMVEVLISSDAVYPLITDPCFTARPPAFLRADSPFFFPTAEFSHQRTTARFPLNLVTLTHFSCLPTDPSFFPALLLFFCPLDVK